jgi:transcriptional regulator with XRE-family HTH domain
MPHMADQPRGTANALFERVNSARAEQGWTWTRLQERSGVARSTIYSWAKIQTPPQPQTVNAVADVLGIPRAEALRLAGILSEAIPPDAPVCTFEQEILAAGTAVSDETKAQVIRVHRLGGHSNCRPLAEAAGEQRQRASSVAPER